MLLVLTRCPPRVNCCFNSRRTTMVSECSAKLSPDLAQSFMVDLVVVQPWTLLWHKHFDHQGHFRG